MTNEQLAVLLHGFRSRLGAIERALFRDAKEYMTLDQITVVSQPIRNFAYDLEQEIEKLLERKETPGRLHR